jgi:hypothetical protein
MENYFNPVKNINEIFDLSHLFSSSDIFEYFKYNQIPYIGISFDGGYSYTQIRNFSHFTEYLNFHQSKQPTKKVFFLYEGKNKFLALLESNQSFTVTL